MPAGTAVVSIIYNSLISHIEHTALNRCNLNYIAFCRCMDHHAPADIDAAVSDLDTDVTRLRIADSCPGDDIRSGPCV